MQEGDQSPDIEDDIPQAAIGQYMVHQFKTFVGSALSFGIELSVETTLPTTTSPAYLEIFNHVSGLWEQLEVINNYGSNITFVLHVSKINSANYINTDRVISVRTWQFASSNAVYSVDLYRVLLPVIYQDTYSKNNTVFQDEFSVKGSLYIRAYPRITQRDNDL